MNLSNLKNKQLNLQDNFQVKNQKHALIYNGFKNGKNTYMIHMKLHIEMEDLEGLAQSIIKKV